MNENMTCGNCGCTNEELVEIFIHGDTVEVCEDCARELGYVKCAECGEWIPEGEAMETADGETICESCYEAWFFTCEDCGSIVRIDDGYTVNPGWRNEAMVCENCSDDYYRCDDCEALFSRNHVYLDNYGNHVCHDCYDNHDWSCCSNCGQLVRMDDANWDEYEQEYYCDDCWSSHHRHSSNFHDYYYKPTPELKFRSSETNGAHEMPSILTFGVELEVDEGDDHIELADKLADLDMPIYMKHDGSLGEEGVEIVTHPCSLAYHQYELRWSEITRICKADGFRSHDAGTCGLHIHVGVEQMGETASQRRVTKGNLVLLTHKLWDELVKFSRRTDSQLDDWACRPRMSLVGEYTDMELTEIANDTENYGRYQACNLCNTATVEFRIFRGTLVRNTLIASIQLVSNLTKYAMTHTPTECRNATWADVIGIEQFKELDKYNTERGL